MVTRWTMPFVMFLGAALGAGAPGTIAIDISALDRMPPQARRALMQETSAIWAPHGVSMAWITSLAERVPMRPGPMLSVVGPDGCSSSLTPLGHDPRVRSSPRLGAIVFLDGHVNAENTIVLSIDAITRLVDETYWLNRRVADWPAGVEQELVGRAAGRVLAHEIGHYLLGWRAHTPDGLMRAGFGASALLDPARLGFEIPRQLVPRLSGRLAQLAGPRPAIAQVE